MRLPLTAALLALPLVALADAPPARPRRPRPQQPAASACPLRPGQNLAGTYLCAQGWTDVDFHVREVRGARVRAEFVFRHAPSGAAGRFTLTGSCDPGGRVRLTPEAWIERPDGYIMVGMDGVASGDGRFEGRMTHVSCGRFALGAR